MSGRVVADASVLVAMLADGGPAGRWATDGLRGSDVVAPQHVVVESASALRRLELGGSLSTDQAAQAHADLVAAPIELWPYQPCAGRAWQLRANLTTYDAAYVALAELLDAPLLTLDGALARAPGVLCEIRTPRRR